MTNIITLDRLRDCQMNCGEKATVYALDPYPGGWGGHYCEKCADRLRFQVVDRYVLREDAANQANTQQEA